MEVGGKIMGVNVVGEMVEVGGKVIEVNEVDDEGVEVPALVACADPTLGEDAGAIDVLGATGFKVEDAGFGGGELCESYGGP